MIANYHTHTTRCNHATGTEEEYVQSALERGLEILGFSDHTPYTFPEWHDSWFRMKLSQLDGYCDTILSLQKAYAGKIELPLGLELEYYPAYLPELLPILRDRPVEYLLLGQHFVENEVNAHYSGKATADVDILKTYCAQSAEAMQTGLFTYFAHPDLINFRGEDSIYRQHMRLLCTEAKSCGIPLEINLLGIQKNRHYPDIRFWEIAAEENCPVILGCDAHNSWELTDLKPEQEALAMVEQLGLKLLNKASLVPIK